MTSQPSRKISSRSYDMSPASPRRRALATLISLHTVGGGTMAKRHRAATLWQATSRPTQFYEKLRLMA